MTLRLSVRSFYVLLGTDFIYDASATCCAHASNIALQNLITETPFPIWMKTPYPCLPALELTRLICLRQLKVF